MKIIHNWRDKTIQQETFGEARFLLSDKKGGWLSLGSQPTSRYQGWFALQNQKPYKILDDLLLVEGNIESLRNNFWSAERQTGKTTEHFWLSSQPRALVYELSQPAQAEITLDFKEPYDNQTQASYESREEQGILVVKCSLPTETIFLALKSDTGRYFPLNQTINRHYSLDESRNSPPFERLVCRLARFQGQKLVLAVGNTFGQAKEVAEKVFRNLARLKKIEQSRVALELKNSRLSRGGSEMQMAYWAGRHSLASLAWETPGQEQVYAGLPWFFQFWTRDATMALASLRAVNPQVGLKIFWRLIHNISPQGFLPKLVNGPVAIESADGLGWLAKATEDLWSAGYLKKAKPKELQDLQERLCQASHGLAKNYTQGGLIVNQAFSTWMDSLERSGFRIEIQALALALYHVTYQLTQNNYYWLLEMELKNKVRERFWDGQELLDGCGDLSVRPNVFLAAYLYPELLKKEEWIKCFQNILPKLWLEWGGIATVETQSALFQPRHTGETPASYHNGDSWFYLNNLAALVLHRLDSRRFKFYIDKIFQASLKEILWQGAIGHHAELSSAQSLQSQGCWAQAWSAALFCELAAELYK